MARDKHGHFEWLAFDKDQKLFDFKINFLSEFVSSASRILFLLVLDKFFMATCLWYRTKDIDFELKFLLETYQVLQGHLLWLEVNIVTLSS